MLVKPQGYKTFSMFNSTEHEYSNAHRSKMLKNKDSSCFQLSAIVLIMVIYVKMPTIVGTLTFVSMIDFMLS